MSDTSSFTSDISSENFIQKSPERLFPKDLSSAQRMLSSLHKELLELKRANYVLEQKCLSQQHIILELQEKIRYIELKGEKTEIDQSDVILGEQQKSSLVENSSLSESVKPRNMNRKRLKSEQRAELLEEENVRLSESLEEAYEGMKALKTELGAKTETIERMRLRLDEFEDSRRRSSKKKKESAKSRQQELMALRREVRLLKEERDSRREIGAEDITKEIDELRREKKELLQQIASKEHLFV